VLIDAFIAVLFALNYTFLGSGLLLITLCEAGLPISAFSPPLSIHFLIFCLCQYLIIGTGIGELTHKATMTLRQESMSGEVKDGVGVSVLCFLQCFDIDGWQEGHLACKNSCY